MISQMTTPERVGVDAGFEESVSIDRLDHATLNHPLEVFGMRIALIDSFPNVENKAEAEFIARFRNAATLLEWTSAVVVTSDDIHAFKPDLVIALHELSPKLTQYPTVGIVWSPLSFFRDDPYRVKCLHSYDGYLVGNAANRRFLRDSQIGLGVVKPIGPRLFLPSACNSVERAFPRSGAADLCYIGVHWDGDRHGELLASLSRRRLVRCYGPPASWGSHSDCYVDAIPFDGVSVQNRIAAHGIALCLHKYEHRTEDMPSMRIFEALSVGAILICDRLPFAVEYLSEIAFFVDPELVDANLLADEIERIIDWTNDHPEAAAARGARGRKWFEDNWSLKDRIKQDLIPLYHEVLDRGQFNASPFRGRKDGHKATRLKHWLHRSTTPEVDVVIRTGGRPVEFVSRALQSVRAASASTLPLRALIVDYGGRPEIERLAHQQSASDFPVHYLRSPSNGFRSTTLWTGLQAANAPFVAHLDDDDTVSPNHFRQLHTTLARFPNTNMAYSGVVRFEEDGVYTDAPNFAGELDQVIPERRKLEFLEAFDLVKLARFHNFIQSNSWMCRTPFLQSIIGEDPELAVVEDVYLYLLAASHGPLSFTGSATAIWHWRHSEHQNSMSAVSQPVWAECQRRVRRLLANIHFSTTLAVDQLARLGGESDSWSSAATSSLRPLEEAVTLHGGLEIARAVSLRGFHGPEGDGVWTAADSAQLEFMPSARLREMGGTLRLIIMPAPALEPGERWFEIEVKGGESTRRYFEDTHDQQIELSLGAKKTGKHIVLLRVSDMLPGGRISADRRDLGLYVKSIAIDLV